MNWPSEQPVRCDEEIVEKSGENVGEQELRSGC